MSNTFECISCRDQLRVSTLPPANLIQRINNDPNQPLTLQSRRDIEFRGWVYYYSEQLGADYKVEILFCPKHNVRKDTTRIFRIILSRQRDKKERDKG